MVQMELEAMSKAAVEMAESVVEKTSSFTSSLADIAKECACGHGRDTSKEDSMPFFPVSLKRKT